MHIDVHVSALGDLRQIKQAAPRAAAAIAVALAELQADPNVFDKLTTYGNNIVGPGEVNVKPWIEARSRTPDLWRLRILNTPATAYRVVYGYHWVIRQIVVLAVVHKDSFDYELTSDLAKRILADWCAV